MRERIRLSFVITVGVVVLMLGIGIFSLTGFALFGEGGMVLFAFFGLAPTIIVVDWLIDKIGF